VKLKGVVWDSRRPLAVVEDGAGVTYIIKSGDRVGEDQLRAIKPDRIVLRKKSGKTYELSLTKP
jgi:type II secretory pathway component PulC